MDQFYVTLPSNSSFQHYGFQPITNYKTKLAKDLHLDVDDWEVGLAEFIYPISWHNVINGTFRVRMLINDNWVHKTGRVPDNRYKNIPQLLDTIKEELKRLMGEQIGSIDFSYLQTGHIKVHTALGYNLRLSPVLADALGFGGDGWCELTQKENDTRTDDCDVLYIYSEADTIISSFIADVDRRLKSLYIHCNIVQSQLVGDMHVPLLRTVVVQGQTNDVVAKSFTNVHYMSLERSILQEIEIHITDDSGRDIPFKYGRVIAKLHFKRK